MIYFCIKFFLMPLTKEEFDVMKAHQFCDNRDCPKYGLVGQGNIKTHSFASGQVLCSGMGQNAICRQEDVTGDSVRSWIILASKQVSAFTEYMQRDMHLEQVQIDEFWSFIRKKKRI